MRPAPEPRSLDEAFASAPNEAEALRAGVGWIATRSRADACDLFERQPSGGLLLRVSTAHSELEGRLQMARGVGVTGQALELARAVVVPSDLRNDPRYALPPGLREPDYLAAIGLPVANGGGSMGALLVRRLHKWVPTPGEVALLERSALEFALAWRVYRGAFDAGSHNDRLNVLTEVTDTLTGTPYLEEILQHLVNLTARRFNYVVVSLRLLDAPRQHLVLRAAYSTQRAYPKRPVIALGESIAGKVIQRGRLMVVQDVQTDAEFIGHDLAVEHGLRSMVCVPLKLYNRAVGVMSCYTAEVREFPRDELATLETIAKQAAVSIEHAKLQVRDTLMQEMHHRVKNNLQQVASLLRLQIRHSHYRSVEEALGDSLGRIEAIAAVHELLSREDLDLVSLRSVSETLVQHQQQSFLPPGKKVGFSVRGDDVFLNTTQATQVALVLNELIQNAVTHGFRTSDEGEVHVTIEDREGLVGVWVSNDGDPLPKPFDARTGRLGLQIVEGLSRALGGTFKLEERLGWTVSELTFLRTTGE